MSQDVFSLLQQSRSNRNLWYVFAGDQQTLFARIRLVSSTNVQTNWCDDGGTLDAIIRFALLGLSNSSPANLADC